ncbi:MAG: hypothetical protein ACOVSR_02400 [Bacteroidia bacterium]
MKSILKIVLLIIAFQKVNAQIVHDPIGARSWSLGGSNAAESNVFSVINNMASSAELKNYQLGIYNQTRFGVKELNLINSSFLLPTKFIHLGLGINHYGYEKYNQQNFSFGIAKKLNNNFNLGVTINYLTINIAEQENTGALTGSLSVFYKINKNLQLGVLLFNPTQSNYHINTYGKVNTFGRIGVKYQVNKSVYLIGDLDKTLEQETILRGGINYSFHPNFDLSLGYANNPNYLTLGFNAKVKKMDLAFAASMHEILGFTPHIGLIFYGK